MTTLKIVFIIMASINIGINILQLFEPETDSRLKNFSAIAGWSCAIMYCIQA